ncbi:MAG: hydratase [Alphaproteobacteria bacterium]|nr:hydratase [Alphaproteobacteria bacterium]
MTDGRAARAAETIWGAWRDERLIDGLGADCRPRTLDEGYAAQAALPKVSGQPVVGWKIAATSKAGQAHLQVTSPLAGRLLADRLHRSPARLPLRRLHMAVAEAEFAFRIAADLPAGERPYTTDEVMARVLALHPAIEIPDSRIREFAKAGAPQLVADDACANFLVLGADAQGWRGVDLSRHPARMQINGRWVRDGIGANVLGDPRIALTWLANDRAERGEPLLAGQVVTTGTCMEPVRIALGDRVLVDFGQFGTAEASIGG